MSSRNMYDAVDGVQSQARVLADKEAADLELLERRLSVRDLATQFESGQAAAAKLLEDETLSSSKEVKHRGHQCDHTHGHTHVHSSIPTKNPSGDGPPPFRSSLRRTSGNLRDCEKLKVQEVGLMELPAIMKQLRGLLGELAGRVAGRNKDDVTEALSLVEVMKAKWTQKESELEQDVRKQAALLKQVLDDARRMVEEAQANAYSEVEAAHATVLHVKASLMEQAESVGSVDKQELEEMRKEITEARRIKMLHEPSKTMDMEFEIEGLRQQLTQKSVELIHLRKETWSSTTDWVLGWQLVAAKRVGQPGHYELQGEERLGASLIISPLEENGLDISTCTIQWHRESADRSKGGPITGATRPQYAPEPFDVGWILRVGLVLPGGKQEILSTSGPLDAAPGLDNFVEALFKKGGAEFNVRLVQQNGEILGKPLLHVLRVERNQITLFKGRTTKAKEDYSSIIWLCGARGGGQAAMRSLYWVANKGLSLMLVLESERERNAAIMLSRRFASDQNVALLGPDDRLFSGTAPRGHS